MPKGPPLATQAFQVGRDGKQQLIPARLTPTEVNRGRIAGPAQAGVRLLHAFSVVVARIGFSATTSRESRQGRKAAAAAMMSGAGVSADTGHLHALRVRRKAPVRGRWHTLR